MGTLAEIDNLINFKTNSEEIDKNFGFKVFETEEVLLKRRGKSCQNNILLHGPQEWIGLHPSKLQTPYCEIEQFYSIIKLFLKPKKIVDFGAGYGRLGIVKDYFFNNCEFIGFEKVKERVQEGNRVFNELNLLNCHLVEEDITMDEFQLPEADVVFIYDFSEIRDQVKLLKKLSNKFFDKKSFIVARGKGIRNLIQLKFPEFYALNGCFHFENWSLYSSFIDLNDNKTKETINETISSL